LTPDVPMKLSRRVRQQALLHYCLYFVTPINGRHVDVRSGYSAVPQMTWYSWQQRWFYWHWGWLSVSAGTHVFRNLMRHVRQECC